MQEVTKNLGIEFSTRHNMIAVVILRDDWTLEELRKVAIDHRAAIYNYRYGPMHFPRKRSRVLIDILILIRMRMQDSPHWFSLNALEKAQEAKVVVNG